MVGRSRRANARPDSGRLGEWRIAAPEQRGVIDETPTRADTPAKDDVSIWAPARRPNEKGAPGNDDDERYGRSIQLQDDLIGGRNAADDFPSASDDSVELILWYHNASVQPIYSVDARQTSNQPSASDSQQLVAVHGGEQGSASRLGANLLHAKHHAPAKLQARLKVKFNLPAERAYLIIDRVEPADFGQYKCRVDFKYARTRYQVSQLNVISE